MNSDDKIQEGGPVNNQAGGASVTETSGSALSPVPDARLKIGQPPPAALESEDWPTQQSSSLFDKDGKSKI